MNVPGRKNRVTRVIIRIETVSCVVFRARTCISLVMTSMFCADTCDLLARSPLASIFWYSRIPCNCNASVYKQTTRQTTHNTDSLKAGLKSRGATFLSTAFSLSVFLQFTVYITSLPSPANEVARTHQGILTTHVVELVNISMPSRNAHLTCFSPTEMEH